MKVAIFALLTILLVATLYVDQSDAWPRFRFRGRRFFRRVGRILRKACPFACRNYCKIPGVCSPVCGKVCGRRRRDLAMEDSKPFPAHFQLYDQDRDDRITLDEFARAIQSDERHSAPAFELADLNADGQLDDAEFASAPFSTSQNLDDDLAALEDEGLADME